MSKVVPGRLELPTSTLSVWRSNQLSYRTMIFLRACVLRITRPGQLRFQVSGLQKPGFLHSLYSKQTAAYKKPVKESHLQVDFLLSNYFALPCVPPERRCSSRTFRYGYLVTT